MLRTLASALGSLAMGFGAASANDLTVTSWGGAYMASQKNAFGAPWEAKSGKKIRWQNYVGGLGEVNAQVQSGKVTWDVVVILPAEARIGCQKGLFEELPDSIFSRTADGKSLDEDLLTPRPNKCVAPQTWWSYVPFYDEKTYKDKEAPKAIGDFFDVKKFPGKRGVHSWANALIEMALVADGVAVADVYKVMDTKEGLDRAFAKLDTIKEHLVFWSSGVKPLQLVKSGEVVMAIGYNGQIGAARLFKNEKLVTMWDGQVLEEEWLAVVKGAPNKDAALDFVGFATAPQQQANQAKYINYGPMRKSAYAIIEAGEPWFQNGKAIMKYLPSRAEVRARSVIANPEWWLKNGDAIRARFDAWRSKL